MNWLTDRQRQYLERACCEAGIPLPEHSNTVWVYGGSRGAGKMFFKQAYEAGMENPMLLNVLSEENMELRRKVLGDW